MHLTPDILWVGVESEAVKQRGYTDLVHLFCMANSSCAQILFLFLLVYVVIPPS
jgi:hypothetical protein